MAEPAYAGAFRPRGFHGTVGLLDDRATPAWPFRLEVQNVGAEPDLCRKLGNETYCY